MFSLNTPEAALTGFVVVVVVFHKSIKEVIEKNGFKTPWASSTPPDSTTQQTPSPSTDAPSESFGALVKEEQKQSEGVPREKLEEELGRAKVELEFERSYRTIFGTQLAILKSLNIHHRALPTSSFEHLLQEHIRRGGPYKDVSTLLVYLVSVGFIHESDGMYTISERGNIFLMYLTMQQYPEDKEY